MMTKEQISIVRTLIDSCEEAISGEWDYIHDEGGFEAMLKLLYEILYLNKEQNDKTDLE